MVKLKYKVSWTTKGQYMPNKTEAGTFEKKYGKRGAIGFTKHLKEVYGYGLKKVKITKL